MSRYSRHIALKDVGQEGQDKLTNSKVLVIGAGGLGCPVLQYLAAAGVGTIGIVDFDVVEESNLQRQILFGRSVLGKNKALAAKQRLADINDTITINTYTEALTAKNALSLFKGYDIIVDGTDNFATRYLINDAAVLTHKPLVYGAIYKFEGQVSVFNYNDGPNYRCLFPSPPKNGAPNCSDVGVLGVLPGIIGCMQANEVLKIILDLNDVLSGKMYCYNAKTTDVFMMNIKKSEKTYNEIINSKPNFENSHNIEACTNTIQEITFEDALSKTDVLFVDVRELNEQPEVEGVDHLKLPLSNFENTIKELSNSNNIMLFCKSGMRSKKAVSILQKHNINNSYSVKGGVIAITDYLKIKI